MHFRLFVLTLIVMMGRFPVVMCGRFVIGRSSVMMCARRVFCNRSHQQISFEKNSHDVLGRSARLTSVKNLTDFLAA
jgi:hypothetical protein